MSRNSASRASPGEDHAILAVAMAPALDANDTAARSVTEVADATEKAVSAVVAVEARSRYPAAAATKVAAAAAAASEIAAGAAAAAQAGTMLQASKVAAAAVAALEGIVADLPKNVSPQWARSVAAVVASTVASEVIAQTRLAGDAAGRVSDTVSLAAEGAALAALAASLVGLAKQAEQGLDHTSADPDAASNVAVNWTARVSDLATRRTRFMFKTSMVVELQRALTRSELRLHYQPIYNVRTNAIVAVEALLRWAHPTRGMLPPAEFLDVVEGPRLVAPIGDWVLETAAKQASLWQRSLGDRAPKMWVNISCEQLGQNHLVGVVKRLLDVHHLVTGSFGIEVTERQLAYRLDDVVSDLTGLRTLGVPLAVDDFGTGYASMDYLRRFVFDEIKIDRSFIAGFPDRINRALVSSMMALGGSLGLNVIAEGVETIEELNQLKQLGCEFAQGYLWNRPEAADIITTLLTAKKPDTHTLDHQHPYSEPHSAQPGASYLSPKAEGGLSRSLQQGV